MTFVSGHFGEWLQGHVGPNRRLALVTLNCPVAGARVRTTREAVPRLLQNEPVLEIDRCRRFLTSLCLPTEVSIRLEVDLPPGGGAGMSTAALVALARANSAEESKIAAACLAVEGATDPLMLASPDGVLWAPRSARALAPVPLPPAAEIVGGFWGPPCATDPNDLAFPVVDDLVDIWKEGPSLSEAARLATLSHERTTELRGPKGDPTVDIAQRLGALGVARAHTGSARSVIFAPGTVPSFAEHAMRNAGYTSVIRFPTGGGR